MGAAEEVELEGAFGDGGAVGASPHAASAPKKNKQRACVTISIRPGYASHSAERLTLGEGRDSVPTWYDRGRLAAPSSP